MGTTRGIIEEGTEGPINLGPERPRVYSELSQEEKDRYNADIRATNIILQGLPKDIYSLINHYIDAKDIWDNVKMLLEGSELTKEDRESQLYDDFEHFRQNKRRNHSQMSAIYVSFASSSMTRGTQDEQCQKILANSSFVTITCCQNGEEFVYSWNLQHRIERFKLYQLMLTRMQHEAHAKR
ncbi:hypothetical protein Tco_1112119 [Tanacetum coccineum]|uniref:Integrase, catalytic region, zinc finger, CCHC-type, peptidase aspartic, catalytic n=1 Tax=Tanacetum coccineum TaxID=301880 RepID=A0ABQ5INJ7_9ASTR